MWHIAAIEEWHLDIDNILRFFIPRNYTHLLPSPISRFLGYRDGRQKPIGNVFIAVWALVGAFVGVVVLEALFMAPEIRRHSPPPVIASFVSKDLSSATNKPHVMKLGSCSDSPIQCH